MVRMATTVVVAALMVACSGGGGEDLAAVCDDFQAAVDDGHQLPEDWAAFEPVVARAAEVDDLEGAAANIRADMDAGGDPDALVSSVEGFYFRCREAGWDG